MPLVRANSYIVLTQATDAKNQFLPTSLAKVSSPHTIRSVVYVCMPFLFFLCSFCSPLLTHPFAHTPHRTSSSTTGNRAGTADYTGAIHPFLVYGFPEGWDDDATGDDDGAVPVGDGVRRRMRVKPDKKARNGAKPKKGAWDNNFF